MKQSEFLGKRKLIFLTFIFLSFLFFPIVVAQPVTQINVNINQGLEIEFTKIEFLENGNDHIFNAHVFNISTGLRVDDTTTDCSFHLFNNVGFHQINQQPMIYDGAGLDWEFNVTGGNFTRNGAYSYLMVCNSTDLGGFLSTKIEVTPTGIDNLTQFYWLILSISVVILLLGFWLRDSWVIIFGTFGLYFIGLYILLNGIVGVKDMVTTWAIGLIILGIAAYISIRAAGEVMNG